MQRLTEVRPVGREAHDAAVADATRFLEVEVLLTGADGWEGVDLGGLLDEALAAASVPL